MEGVTASLKRHYPEAVVVVQTAYPEAAALVNGLRAVKQKTVPFRLSNVRKNLALLYLLIGARFLRRGIDLPGMRALMAKLNLLDYEDTDLIVSTGGSFINDFYAPANIGRLWGLYWAKLLGKAVVLFAQSIGPLDRFVFRRIARHVLSRTDLIALRDPRSSEILAAIGVKGPRIVTTVDAAFLMPLNAVKPLQLLRHEPVCAISRGPLNVSISVRTWRHYSDPLGHDRYVSAVAGLCDWLVREKQAHVHFLSTCTGLCGYQINDHGPAYEVIRRMDSAEDGNPRLVLGEYTPQELVEMYGSMDLHVGTRMHSNILALLGGTPVVAIQYEFKTHHLMELFGMTDYLLSIDGITAEALQRTVENALSNREALRKDVEARLPAVRERAAHTGELIHSMLTPAD